MGGESRGDTELWGLAQPGLDWLADDIEELTRFMAECGYSPDRLRAAIGSRDLAVALIEYFARNEPKLVAMTANGGTSIDDVMRAYWLLNPGER